MPLGVFCRAPEVTGKLAPFCVPPVRYALPLLPIAIPLAPDPYKFPRHVEYSRAVPLKFSFAMKTPGQPV